MKLAIIGHGFVGKALENGLTDDVEIFLVDPKYKTKVLDLQKFKPDIIFVCVPTPSKTDGSQDESIIIEVIDEISKIKISGVTVIKSTVLPDNLITIQNKIKNIVYNPEFLRESHANKDFINSDLIVFGGDQVSTKLIESFYKQHTKCICSDYIHTDIITASFIKYTINTFLATKLTYFNELYRLFRKSGAIDSWDNFIGAIARDKRIGNSHMNVPGPDGKFGYGGACFPKDSKAFLDFSEKQDKTLEILRKSIEVNKNIRR